MNRLSGKVALITGAGAGIGRSAALLFANEGAKVIVAELPKAAGEETVRLVAAAGGEALFVQTDVTEPDSMQTAVRTAVEAFGKLDIMYNNAGGSTPQDNTAVDVTIDEFWRACPRRLNFDPPCRPNSDPGMEAGSDAAGCVQV